MIPAAAISAVGARPAETSLSDREAQARGALA